MIVAPGRHALVTGGAGFIGSHLVELLLARGVRVSVIDDLSRGSRDWLAPGCELHEIDLVDGDAVRRTVRELGADIVAHLAALHYIPAVDEAPALAHAVNVQGTANLLDALADAPPARFLFASTAAVYPNADGPLDETVPPSPVDLYGRTKLEGERLVREFAARSSCRCILARLFNVIGSRETNPHVVAEIVDQLRDGAVELRLGSLEPRRDYLDVRDTARALLVLMDSDGNDDVYNVGSGEARSVSDLVAACAQILGRPIPVHREAARVRILDRLVLVADASRLRALGWRPEFTVERSLRDLLNGAR